MRLNPALAGGVSLSVLLIAALGANHIHTTGNKYRHFADPSSTSGPGLPATPTNQAKSEDLQARKQKRIRTMAEEDGGKAVSSTDTSQGRAVAEGKQLEKFGAAARQRNAPFAIPRPVSPPEGKSFESAPPAVPAVQAPDRVAAAPQPSSRPALTHPDRPASDYREDQGRDRFASVTTNPIRIVSEDPVSTFSVDVDTASYAFMRSSLNNNVLPQKDAVRVEELINYFPYDYEKPSNPSVPFKTAVSIYPAPWNAERKLMHIGIAGYNLKRDEKPASNLVFLIDTSGSMAAPNKLPLAINSMKLLLETLRPDDLVAIVAYAGNAGTVLEPTQARNKTKILAALNKLASRGSTAGGEGIRQAYELAKANFKKQGVNRVILATDGDFNVGITDTNELKSYIERQRNSGIFLSVLGFGRGNYNDALMQTLAQNGNGTAAYVDTLNEARKVLVEEASSTLFPIAKDVKIQIEFNPAKVAEYRLIGYETRMLKREDFNNDKVDAGEVGAGHRVTAIYEITPAGSSSPAIDAPRYGTPGGGAAAVRKSDEYGFLKLRYKLPDEDKSKLSTQPITAANDYASVKTAPREARFATAVAAFGQILKGGEYTGSYSYDDVIALAQNAKGEDEFGYRAEFINLVRLAKTASAMDPLRR